MHKTYFRGCTGKVKHIASWYVLVITFRVLPLCHKNMYLYVQHAK